jgi:predicted RNase H-like HicB family nuclease
MEKTFTASIYKESNLYVAQCLEVDVASQGVSQTEALNNLKEALELHFDDPRATDFPIIDRFQAEINVA